MTGRDGSAPAGRLRRALHRRPVVVVLGVLVTGLAAVAGIRLLDSGAAPGVIAVEAGARWLLIGAYPVLLAALLGRLRVLSVLAGVLCLAQLALLGQAYSFGSAREAATSDPGSVLRVTTANILLDNASVDDLAAQLAQEDDDVVLLQEVTPEHLDRLEASPLWSAYPYRLERAREGFQGQLVLSRFPLEDGSAALPDALGDAATSVLLRTPAGPVRVVGVHLTAPVTAENAAAWRTQLGALTDLATAEGGPPLVIAGDFNATLDHAAFRTLLHSDVTDAFAAAGRGFGFTWPAALPLLRLDHVLTGNGIEPLSAAVTTNPGSDHLRLVTTLEIDDPVEDPR